MSAIDNLRLTAKLIPIIAPFIADGDIRYYLNGINVRPHKGGGAVICATNGHALGALHDAAAVCDAEVTLRLDPRLLLACRTRIAEDRVVKVINGRLAVVEGDNETEAYLQAGNPVLAETGRYPRYENVIPKADGLKPGMPGAYAANLVGLAETAAKAAAKAHGKLGERYNAIRFLSHGGENDSGVVRLEIAPEFVGVLMPMRVDSLKKLIPTWVESLSQADDLAAMAGAAA